MNSFFFFRFDSTKNKQYFSRSAVLILSLKKCRNFILINENVKQTEKLIKINPFKIERRFTIQNKFKSADFTKLTNQ